jgi:hypothetical protein
LKDLKRPILEKPVIALTVFALWFGGDAGGSEPSLLLPDAKVEAGTSLKGRVDGSVSPGSRVRLCLEQPPKPGSRVLWVQTDGPTFGLEGQTGPELRLTVPPGAGSLGFLLVVNDEQGIKTATFHLPIGSGASPSIAMPGSVPALDSLSTPKADAGDDTIGLVGRRVTLNASESRPRDGLNYRWIQVDGPQLVALDEAGRFCSFVPTVSGVYRFALVVAYENRISPADFVVVSVGTPPGAPTGPTPLAGNASPSVAPSMTPGMPVQAAISPLDAAVSQALATLDDAPIVAGPLAEIFQAASLRMDLYRTYGEIFSEMSRRLETVVPTDPIRRSRWNALLFEPLTAQTVAGLVPLGLDLRVPGSQDAPLTNVQKQELRTLFDRLARRLASPRPSR